MRKSTVLLFTILLVTSLFSCTLSKRHHQPGFYFSWNHSGSATKAISSTPTNQIESDIIAEIEPATMEVKNFLEKKDTIPPQSASEIQLSTELQPTQEIPKSEKMKIEASQIQALHRIKQLVTVGGLFGVVMGSFFFATAYSVAYPFLGVLLLVALFAGITALIGFIITVKVTNFKKKYPEFSDTPEFKKVLKARKRARLSLYFSYGLLSIDLILAFFALLISFFTVY